MTLTDALHILCRAHTRTEMECGFVVHATPGPDLYDPPGRYVEAWERVRQEIGLPTRPERMEMAEIVPGEMPAGEG